MSLKVITRVVSVDRKRARYARGVASKTVGLQLIRQA